MVALNFDEDLSPLALKGPSPNSSSLQSSIFDPKASTNLNLSIENCLQQISLPVVGENMKPEAWGLMIANRRTANPTHMDHVFLEHISWSITEEAGN